MMKPQPMFAVTSAATLKPRWQYTCTEGLLQLTQSSMAARPSARAAPSRGSPRCRTQGQARKRGRPQATPCTVRDGAALTLQKERPR